MGRQRDEQIGFLPAGRGIASRLEKFFSERGLEKILERRVEPQQAVAIVEIAERETEGELHPGRIIVQTREILRCRSEIAYSSSPAAHRASARQPRRWRRPTARRS